MSSCQIHKELRSSIFDAADDLTAFNNEITRGRRDRVARGLYREGRATWKKQCLCLQLLFLVNEWNLGLAKLNEPPAMVVEKAVDLIKQHKANGLALLEYESGWGMQRCTWRFYFPVARFS
jgi:hypothetical protein